MFVWMWLLPLLSPAIPQDVSPMVDVKILSELPLDRLLQVRNTFQIPADESVAEDRSSPQALALQGKLQPIERGSSGGYYDDSVSKKSGKKGIQNIFQLSITTLAFLAFGGYLLCLLVQAIKAKETTMMMAAMNTETMAALLNSVNRRRRRPTTRRPPIRKQPPRGNKYRKSSRSRPKRDLWHDIDTDQMYYVLLNLSEAYTDYHTIDYRHFNYTKSHYFS